MICGCIGLLVQGILTLFSFVLFLSSFQVGLDDDGQLVINDTSSGMSLWASGNSGGDAVYMQNDGNLVVMDGAKNILWSSNTFGPGAKLAIDE